MHLRYLYVMTWVLCFGGFLATAHAQQDSIRQISYPAINENLLVQTKWRYTYTTHRETNTVLHKADADYNYFLFWKYDNTYQMYLNGELTAGTWKLNDAKNEIYYPFRKTEWWRIAEFTEETLILEYTQHNRTSYRAHFVRVTDDQAPFVRAPNDLPDVLVDYVTQRPSKYKHRYIKGEKGKRQRYSRRERRRIEELEKVRRDSIQQLPFMQIELVGGGFYGGVDKVYRNNLVIKTNGQVIQEFQSELQGLQVIRRSISRQTVEQLVAFIESNKFFEFQQTYMCETRNCIERMQSSPRPIALRIAVTHGARRKVVVVNIWDGKGYQNAWVKYPPALDTIVKTIQDTALYQ